MENIFDNLSDSNLKKIENKAIKVLLGLFAGYFIASMATKFVEDNFSFRIKKISKLPDNTQQQN